MIYLDSCALVKFIRDEAHTDVIRAWRAGLAENCVLLTSELSELEITRTMTRAGIDHQRVPYLCGQALRGVHVVALSPTVLGRAKSYRIPRLGSLDSLHLATADLLRTELTGFVTYDGELFDAATELGIPASAPR